MNPRATEWPSARTSASLRRSAAGSVIVSRVRGGRGPARICSCRSRSPKASSTSPEEEACSGRRPAIRVTFDPESGEATNVYVWESESAARAFFTPELTEQIVSLYGVQPEIRFVEVAALIDNGVGATA